MKLLLALLFTISFSSYSSELVLTAPEAVSTEVVVSYKIVYFEVDVPAAVLVVKVAGLNASGVAISSKMINVTGAEFGGLITAMPDSNKNIYDNISSMLYSKLQTEMGGSIQE